MALDPGTRLGPYEIAGSLGAGGMGEVYRARDTRLDRTVAIKVLGDAVKLDPALRARFEREARAVSALDHPNICVLHDVGREGDTDYIVMQYLEGETLAERLSRGPLSLDDALRHGTEIASALARAHHAGILHRDLKPGNVMLTRSHGRELSAKLLDFGLAKVVVPHATIDAQPATVTSPVTGHGTILGTLLYMSPEQLEGREVDARSDIFSFGAVLYEMVTGGRAFDGPSQASVIASILERDPPPVAARAPLAPPALERVVRKCLAKDPDRRWQSASDLCDELSWIAQSSGIQQQPAPAAARNRSRMRPLPLAVGALIAVLAATTAWALLTRPRTDPAVLPRALSIPLPDDVRPRPGGIAVSPDGQTIIYAATTPTPTAAVDNRPSAAVSSGRLYLRRFDGSESTVLAGTENARAPFFSPDGLSVGFFTESHLMRLSLLDRAPVAIVSVPPVTRGGVWLPDDTIVFSPTQSTGLVRVPLTGAGKISPAAFQPLTRPDTSAGEKSHMWPSLLPGGGHILYTIRRGTAGTVDDADIAIVEVASAKSRVVLKGAAYGRYSPTGHLLFVRGKALMAMPFDLDKKEVSGTPSPVVDGLASHAWVGGAHYTTGPDGTLLFMRGAFGQTRSTSMWVDRSGKQLPGPVFGENELGKPRISPDGTRAVFDGTSAEGDGEIYIADVTRGTTVRFSADPQDDFDPIWTADGKKVIWTALPAASLPFLVWRNADGTGTTEAVLPNGQVQFAGSVSPDGVLAYSLAIGGKMCDIWTVPLHGERKARPFLEGPAYEYGPEFSPDGKWIAYVSDEGSPGDVYVLPYPGPGGKRRVTTGGGVAPAWSRDGKELFYQTSTGMMSVPVSYGEDIKFGEPRLLFSGPYVNTSREDGPREYDVAPGGNRFLMLKVEQVPGGHPPSFEVMLNWWTGGLNRR